MLQEAELVWFSMVAGELGAGEVHGRKPSDPIVFPTINASFFHSFIALSVTDERSHTMAIAFTEPVTQTRCLLPNTILRSTPLELGITPSTSRASADCEVHIAASLPRCRPGCHPSQSRHHTSNQVLLCLLDVIFLHQAAIIVAA